MYIACAISVAKSEGPPRGDALLQPRITRRSALQMAGAAGLPALIKPARAAEPSTIRVAFAIQPATLDPQKMRVGGVDYNYVYNCFSRLTTQDPQLQVQPDLATSWDASEDLKTWTFQLRPRQLLIVPDHEHLAAQALRRRLVHNVEGGQPPRRSCALML